jgi:hypothetical protein
MHSIFVVVAEVFVQQAFQMPFIHKDHVVPRRFAPDRDPARASSNTEN